MFRDSRAPAIHVFCFVLFFCNIRDYGRSYTYQRENREAKPTGCGSTTSSRDRIQQSGIISKTGHTAEGNVVGSTGAAAAMIRRVAFRKGPSVRSRGW